MTVVRAIMVFGLALLALIGAFAIYSSARNGDWIGVLMGLAFFTLLGFLFDTLRAEASRGKAVTRAPNKAIFMVFLFACGVVLGVGSARSFVDEQWFAASVKLLMSVTMISAVVAECYLAYRNRA